MEIIRSICRGGGSERGGYEGGTGREPGGVADRISGDARIGDRTHQNPLMRHASKFVDMSANASTNPDIKFTYTSRVCHKPGLYRRSLMR